jgi:hypothetical protein
VRGQTFSFIETFDWTLLLIPGAGFAAATLVLIAAILYSRWRRRRRLVTASREEDMDWEALLEMLQKRSRQPGAAGAKPRDGEEPPEQMLKTILATLPLHRQQVANVDNEDWGYLHGGGVEQRNGQRRWGNPTEVDLSWVGGPERIHGLVINRSTGGLAIFMDKEVPDNTLVQVRPAAAPYYVQKVTIEVRYCRKVGKNFLLGGKFCHDVPWNVRVWFG